MVSGWLRGKGEVKGRGKQGGRGAYRPTSKAGEAMGESSVVTVKMPSNLRSGIGCVMVAEMRAMTLGSNSSVVKIHSFWFGFGRVYLVLPSRTSAIPYSSPKERCMSRKASRARPSSRMFSRRAWRTNERSLRLGSASRGMASVGLAVRCAAGLGCLGDSSNGRSSNPGAFSDWWKCRIGLRFLLSVYVAGDFHFHLHLRIAGFGFKIRDCNHDYR